jgi:hypothetical protein
MSVGRPVSAGVSSEVQSNGQTPGDGAQNRATTALIESLKTANLFILHREMWAADIIIIIIMRISLTL